MDNPRWLAWLDEDPNRLTRINHIRERAGFQTMAREQMAEYLAKVFKDPGSKFLDIVRS